MCTITLPGDLLLAYVFRAPLLCRPVVVMLTLLPLLILLSSSLLLLLFRRVVPLLTLLSLLILLPPGLLLLLGLLVLLLIGLRLSLSFRLGLRLLFLLLLRLILLLLLRISRSSHPQHQKECGRTNYSNRLHDVASIAPTHAPVIYPLRQACIYFDLSRLESGPFVRHPTRIREREWNNPNTLRSHNTTPMTTTPFKIDLILPAMGIKLFTSHRRTPTTIRVRSI